MSEPPKKSGETKEVGHSELIMDPIKNLKYICMDKILFMVKVFFYKEKITNIYEEKMNKIYHITNTVLSKAKRLKEKVIHNPSIDFTFPFRLPCRFNHFVKPTPSLSSLSSMVKTLSHKEIRKKGY